MSNWWRRETVTRIKCRLDLISNPHISDEEKQGHRAWIEDALEHFVNDVNDSSIRGCTNP